MLDEKRIWKVLNSTHTFDIKKILSKAKELKGLTLEEVSFLLTLENPKDLDNLYQTASEIKEEIYGKRIVLFAPLYLSNHCINNCRYCGYQKSNAFTRKKLSLEEIKEEATILENMGHKRLAIECGEDPVNCDIDYVVAAMKTIYEATAIRRLNVNIAATTIANYKKLKDAGIGTYILFQETYHKETYLRVHSGPKANYDWHLQAMDRAMQAGIDDVGLGILFGLFDYRFEVLALLLHAKHLEDTFGVGPHTISVPRLRPALNVNLTGYPHLVSDSSFKKIVAILRLAVPYTGIILSTREKPSFRDELLKVGVSQISAGSKPGVGAYKEKTPEQFHVDDKRSVGEILASLCQSGYLPSYCTACYRSNRTGDRFMALAKTGEIKNICQPNAILTFKEYLLDYANPNLKTIGEQTIQKHLQEIPNMAIKKMTQQRLLLLETGERDLFF